MSRSPDVRRDDLRRRLLAARLAIPAARHAAFSTLVVEALIGALGDANPGIVAGYWPIRAEVDVRPVLEAAIARGGRAALPVPLRRRQPMTFRRWTPQTPMMAGLAGIPHPADGLPLRPDIALVPLLGFDARGHRLGYGGGYYDRTLAALKAPGVVTYGVGFELGRLADVGARPHDIALDFIATETGVQPAKP